MSWLEIGLFAGMVWCIAWIIRLRIILHTVAKNTSGMCDVIKDVAAEAERIDNGQKEIAKSVVKILERDLKGTRRTAVNSSAGI